MRCFCTFSVVGPLFHFFLLVVLLLIWVFVEIAPFKRTCKIFAILKLVRVQATAQQALILFQYNCDKSIREVSVILVYMRISILFDIFLSFVYSYFKNIQNKFKQIN